MILNFAQECYYVKNKVGVVDFTKARGGGVVKFQSLQGALGFKTLPLLGHLQNLLLRKPDFILTSDEKVVQIQQAQKSKFSKVRVGKMADTLALKVESEGVFESDLRSV